YITTFAIARYLPFQWKARLLPRGEPSLQLIDLVEPRLPEQARRRAPARARRRREDHRLVPVLADCVDAVRQLGRRHVPRAGKVAGGVGGAVAHVEDERRSLVH